MARHYIQRSRHRVYRRGRTYYLGRRIHNPDWRIVGLAALVGVAGTVGAMYLQSKVAFMQTNWWAMPAALGLGGVVMLGKMPVIGVGLVVMAGALGYSAYQNKGSAPASGYGDAGALFGIRRDSGMYEGMGALVGGGGRIAARHQGAVGALVGGGARAARTHQGAVGALAGFGSAGTLGL